MRDQLYEIMKQVGDPTVFTEMLNDAQKRIDAEEAAKEQKNVDLDNARAELCEALVTYCEELFDMEEDYVGQHDEMVDKFYNVLAELEDQLVAYMHFMEEMEKFAASKAPAKLQHDGCACGGHCQNIPEPEKVIDTPDAHIEVHKIPVRKDIDVDTVINEFLKSLQ